MITVQLTDDDVQFLIQLENDLGANENWSERVKRLWDINDAIERQSPLVQMMKLHNDAVMSKFVSIEECQAYRRGVRDCMKILEEHT